MKDIQILILCILMSAFYSCDKNASPYSPTLLRIDSLADNEPEKAQPLLEQLKDSLLSFDEEQRMYYGLLSLKINDKMYVRHTSDSLIKRITSFYEKYGDRDKLLESYYYMGRVYRDLHDAPEALKYFQKALDVAGDTKKYLLLSNIYSQMGTLYDYQNVYEEAIRMHKKAYEYTLLAKDRISLPLTVRDIARIYDAIEKNDSAVLYYQKAADLSKKADDRDLFLSLQIELGDLYREMGIYDKALACILESKKDSLDRNMYPTYVALGHTYLELGKIDSADYYLRKAVGSSNLYVKEGLYDYLSQLAERRFDYKESNRYLRLLQQVQDSIRQIMDTEAIRHVTSLYNYQIREKENSRLKMENANIRIKNYKLLSLVSFTISVIILLVYRFKKQKERAAIQMQLLRKEKEAQYERSSQYIEDNNRKLRDLEDSLSQEKKQKDTAQRDLIQVRKELLEVVNERAQLQIVERDLRESEFRHTDICVKFHSACESDQITVKEEDWLALQQELDYTYDGFTNRLYSLYPGLSWMELRICYLIKISIKVTDMAKLLNRSKSSVSSARSRLYKKLSGEEGSPEKLDKLISDF